VVSRVRIHIFLATERDGSNSRVVRKKLEDKRGKSVTESLLARWKKRVEDLNREVW
jgi:hypothetical protein